MLTRLVRHISVSKRRSLLVRQCSAQLPASSVSQQSSDCASKQRDIRLVIFDKDGTLMCFNSLWIPWVKDQAKRIELATGVDMTHEIYRTLGICRHTHRALSGLLAEGTMTQIRDALSEMLHQHLPNRSSPELHAIVENAVKTPDRTLQQQLSDQGESLIVPTADLMLLMQSLKQSGIHTAVCTSDSRENAWSNLKELKIADFVEQMVCGDDPGMPPKPSPLLVQHICRQLQVDVGQTAVVGDTKADMLMANAAQVALKVAVLSGVGQQHELGPLSDVVLPHVGQLHPLLVRKGAKSATSFTQSRKYATSSRHGSTKEYDYVVVGAGSAGCVLAHRLSAAKKSVCLLEAGPPNSDWRLHMPSGAPLVIHNPKYDWSYQTVPQKNLNNRQISWPRGKTLGGSSSINGMVFMRGNPMDFDRWANQENAYGWSYAEVLPYFKRLETYLPAEDNPHNELMQYRGFEGPLHVSSGKFQNQKHTHNPLHQAFIDSAQQAGHAYTHDINGYKQEGVGWFDCTIHNGHRMSTAVTYLKKAKWSNRVDVRTFAHTTKLLFDEKHSKVLGVQVANAKNPGKTENVYARKDVILCAGSINSPQLLMLSGIGCADSLKQVGVKPVLNLPGVGRNLQDHTELYVQFVCKDKSQSLYTAQWNTDPLKMVLTGAAWFVRSTGWGASNHMESGAFIRSNNSYSHANIQIHFLPGAFADMSGKQTSTPGMQMHIGGMRPFSRGKMLLRTNNPFDAPLLDPACLEDPRDVTEFVDCVKLARTIFRQPSFDAFRGEELSPGVSTLSDSQIEAFVRQVAESAYHPCGTCKMGDVKKDPLAVVDPRTMRVHGLDGLRVVDASVMPSETSGNLNAPTIMIAEKASDIILGVHAASPLNVPFWKA